MLERFRFLDKLDIITKSQLGFRKGKLTEAALLKYYNKINGIDQRPLVSVFCGLKKAFEPVLFSFCINGITQFLSDIHIYDVPHKIDKLSFLWKRIFFGNCNVKYWPIKYLVDVMLSDV